MGSCRTAGHNTVARSRVATNTWPSIHAFAVQREQCWPWTRTAPLLCLEAILPLQVSCPYPPSCLLDSKTYFEKSQVLLSDPSAAPAQLSTACSGTSLLCSSNLLSREPVPSCPVWRQFLETKGACFSGHLESGPGLLLSS